VSDEPEDADGKQENTGVSDEPEDTDGTQEAAAWEVLAAADADRSRPGATTEERYARPDADRLSEAMLDRIRHRSTGTTEAAFFDLDKTVIARSSTLAMGRTFFRDGLLSSAMVLKTLYAQAVYQLVGADHERMEQARHAALELTRGWEADRVRHLVRETMEEVIAPLAYQEALDLIAEHRRAGRDVWLISSSGEEIVEPFADYLGIRNVIATRSGLDDEGRYDGTLEFYAYAGAKATAIRQVAEARGYDLARCYAYSDSITDLPMLSVVGHPTAANPDRELRAAAVAMGWDIREFHSPVRLRDRLPDVPGPQGQLVAGVVGAVVIGAMVWRFTSRR
jgi:HAD superfamily hydrolase (TIGR01490 family)